MTQLAHTTERFDSSRGEIVCAKPYEFLTIGVVPFHVGFVEDFDEGRRIDRVFHLEDRIFKSAHENFRFLWRETVSRFGSSACLAFKLSRIHVESVL